MPTGTGQREYAELNEQIKVDETNDLKCILQSSLSLEFCGIVLKSWECVYQIFSVNQTSSAIVSFEILIWWQ